VRRGLLIIVCFFSGCGAFSGTKTNKGSCKGSALGADFSSPKGLTPSGCKDFCTANQGKICDQVAASNNGGAAGPISCYYNNANQYPENYQYACSQSLPPAELP
jgi:hypothetical protein